MTPADALLAAGIFLIMAYTGMLCDPVWASRDFLRGRLRPFVGLALINCVIVPLLAWSMLPALPANSAASVAFLLYAALPCAPLVPALVTLAGEPPEWPLVVFIGFSALSLLAVVALAVVMARSAAHSVDAAGFARKLFHYLSLVYGPMALGVVLRWRKPALSLRWLEPLRKTAGLAVAAFMVLFGIEHGDQFAAIGSRDLALMGAFVAACIVLGALPGRRLTGSRLTATTATAFRNTGLGLAFSTIVLRRPDVTTYLLAYSAVALCACALILSVCRIRRVERLTE